MPAGKTLCIAGESGCGKSVTALSIMGLLPDSARIASGEILFRGQDLVTLSADARRRLRGRDLAMIFQEPMTALNPVLPVQAQLGLSYVFVSHDLSVVQYLCDTVAVMYLGRIVETAPAAALFAAPQHPYTQSLLAAAPAIDPRKRRSQPPLQGDVPSPSRPPPGCAFHTRCPHAMPRCREEVPLMRPVAGPTPGPMVGPMVGHAAACHLL